MKNKLFRAAVVASVFAPVAAFADADPAQTAITGAAATVAGYAGAAGAAGVAVMTVIWGIRVASRAIKTTGK